MKLISLHKNYTTLIKKAEKGNRKAQHQLFELFAPKMLSICRQYVKNNDQAEEVMLNGFLKVFTHLKSFSFQGSFEGWIRRIMVNEAISHLRKEKKIAFDNHTQIENSSEHVSQIETNFEVEEIQKLIDHLPPGYKMVFIMYVVEGYKHSEIAELLKISESTSKSQLYKARKMLQEMIIKQTKSHYGTS